MAKLLFKARLDNIEPVTWGNNDSKKRKEIREAIKRVVPEFDERFIECLLKPYAEISIILKCYLKNHSTKDIDNLVKIPIDAIFFSAKDDSGKYEIGHINKWENNITSLSVKKIKSPQNTLEIMIYGM